MNKEQKDFCAKHDLTENQFFGKEKVGGSLNLGSLTSIPEGFNPTVGGYLYLESLTSIPEGFNPTVGGSLNLGSLTSIPEGFNPTVGGYLYLESLTSIPEGFNPTVGGYLYLGSLTSIPEGFNPTVGGYLYLGSLTSIPEGFNPTVGGNLYLGSLTSIPEGFNPTVGGYLYLESLTSIPEGFNPTVGGYLYLESGLHAETKPYKNKTLSWQNGKYISVDGMFTEVVEKKGNTYKVRFIGKDEISYIVTDGEYHAHGATLAEAKSDLRFKKMAEKLKNEPIKADTLLTVQHYRLITGACDAGVRHFMEQNKIPFKIVGDKTVEVKPIMAKDLFPILVKNNAFGLEKFKSLISF